MPPPNDAVSPSDRSIRFKQLRLGILALGVLALLAFGGASFYDAWRSYRHVEIATDREISNVANALAEQTASTWQAVTLLLDETARWYATDSREYPPERLDSVLETRTAGMPQVRLITIVDAHGIQRHRSHGSSPPNLDVSDRSYFIAQRDGTARGFFLSEPLVTRSENRPGVVISRRLEDDHGQFAGVVTAIVDLETLERLYGAVNLGQASAIHLLRNDGVLLVRNPSVPILIGRSFPELAAVPSAPATRLTNPIDGKYDFIAVAPVRNTHLVLTVTREEAVASRLWRDETIRVAARTLILTLLGAATLTALLQQLRRVETGERALRESEERYALAMEGANEGFWDWHAEGDQLFVSQKMKMLTGHSPDSEFTTRSAWIAQTVVHPEDLQRRDAALKDHFDGLTPRYECEYRVRMPDSSWCWLHARGRCLRDAAGKPYRFVGSVIDVSAQKQAQLDKEHLEAQLRQSQKMEAIGTLAGGIAHDFNNILGAIVGYGELAHQQSPEGTPLRRYLDNVMQATGRARALVNRILGFSRSGLGERVPVNVRAVIEETLELLQASLPAGIRVESRLESGDAAVIGDAIHLHQVAMNLVTNAMQAMQHGGVLSVVLERVDLSERLSLARGTLSPGPYVRLTVSDTGTGIPPAVLERMFDPFFTTKGVGEGTGLGLSLVHGIVTDLGGAIDVSTRAGEGTSFEIWLPTAGEARKPAAEAVQELPRGNGETVMIVDDERALVALVEETLAELGYEPVGFDSSPAALAAFRATPERFDLILTDEAMPDLTGTELTRHLRRTRPDIPIILVSGHGGTQLARAAAMIGVSELLRKPLQRRELAEAVARVLRVVQ
jgi:PAS domain S-box-containing protein